jgi:hypothetical protein
VHIHILSSGQSHCVGRATDAIAGKSPDEQLQILFELAIDRLDRQIKKDQKTKQRLETAIRN